MKAKLLTLLVLGSFTLGVPAYAGMASVEWTNPEDFRDIRPANESRKRFQERTLKELTKYFNKLAGKLPEGYELKLNITDLDLAGNVEFGRTQQIRIVRQIHFPRIAFEYQLFDQDKQALSAEKIDLKDMNFLHNIRTKTTTESLGYEKHMIKEWFTKTMKAHLPKA